ncbi:MAG: hypothetical protein HY616_08940, partial [Candidatus Rokubacteria bacterium]|nr:hypothetical protein [Candidatus Rokubacteria bacterium]
ALAGYKQPKDIVFVTLDELPRSTTGKFQRHQVEAWLRQRPAAPGGRSAASRQAGPLPLS